VGRIASWVVVILAALPAVAPVVSAGAPVSYGKFVATGVFGVPYADSTNLSFPYSYPVFGSGPLQDGVLVYDTQVGVEIVNGEPTSQSFLVVAETWTPATVTVVQNESGPNDTVRSVTVQVPIRFDPSWSNATVTAAAFSSGEVELPLRASSSVLDLEVQVGSASWQLSYLPPATSSVAGVYTNGGVWAISALVAIVTLLSLLVALVAAARLARRIGRSPPVPVLWPAAWVAAPVTWFFFGFVSFNQTLGPASPAILPVPMVLAAFPYLPRLFTRSFEMAEIEGLGPLTLDEAANPKAILPLVKAQGGLKCAPQTWREALLSHWVGLPEVRGYEVKLLGDLARVQPRLVPVSNPLTSYYQAESTASCWFDARKGLKRPRHRIKWTRDEARPVPGPDGATPVGTRNRRHFSPHVVPGFLEGVFPPKRAVAEELAGVRSAEIREHDHEIERIMNADLRGTLDHLARQYADQEIAAHEEARQRQDRPRTREEIERALERFRRSREVSRVDAAAPGTKS
jgi:hypothetical protein